MYRNNGQKKAVRLIALRDYIYGHADQKHAVKIEDIMSHKAKNYLYCPLSCTLRAHERWLYESGRADCARFLMELINRFLSSVVYGTKQQSYI